MPIRFKAWTLFLVLFSGVLFSAAPASATTVAAFIPIFRQSCQPEIDAMVRVDGPERRVFNENGQPVFDTDDMDKNAGLMDLLKGRLAQFEGQIRNDDLTDKNRIIIAYHICAMRVTLRLASENAARASAAPQTPAEQPAAGQADATQPKIQARPNAGSGATANTRRAEARPAAPPASTQTQSASHTVQGEPAHSCISLLKGRNAGAYGGFANGCAFKVFVFFCAFRPKKGAWNENLDCEKSTGGFEFIGAGGKQAVHTNGSHMYWFACKEPAWPKDTRFELGRGIIGRCG